MDQPFIPLSVPNLKGNELKYVTQAVETEWVSTGGHYVEDFERAVASYVGAKGAVACQNGTSGLHVALRLLGVQPGDEVIVPALTFIAAVNPVSYIGAHALFMDCDDSLCLDPNKLEAFCREECELRGDALYDRQTGRRVPAIVVVHVFGNMADMPAILRVAKLYRLKVLEDATEALGTHYTQGDLCGAYAGTMGDMGVYSFNGNKIITTGGGGMIVSNDEELLRRAKHLTTQAKVDQQYFIHDEVGYNYRLTNIQAALGLAQMEQLESFILTKDRHHRMYGEGVQDIPGLSLLGFRPGIRSNKWFYTVICGEGYPLDRDGLIRHLGAMNVQCRPIWGLICDQKPYQNERSYHVQTARWYYDRVVNVPCSTNLTDEDVRFVIQCLREPVRA